MGNIIKNLVTGWEWPILAIIATVGLYFIWPVKVAELLYIFTKLSWGYFFGELMFTRFNQDTEKQESVHTQYQKLGLISAIIIALQLGL